MTRLLLIKPAGFAVQDGGEEGGGMSVNAFSGSSCRLKGLLICLAVAFVLPAWASVKPAPIFGHHMVLQREAALVWGTASAGERVVVTFREAVVEKVAGSDGRWQVELPTGAGGGPFSLTIAGSSNTVTLTDVLVGEVWLGGGQSNMQMALKDQRGGVMNYQDEIKAAEYPRIRFRATTGGGWMACKPATAEHFSATLYFFARRLASELNVPVGVINASVGGTEIALWQRGEALYNSWVSPVVPMRLRGVLWYQGESDVYHQPAKYGGKLTALITGWRSAWGQDWPFYAAQIAPCAAFGTVVVADQTQRALKEQPGTGMISTSDIGDLDDIHPRNKQAVGLRFANLALREQYGKTNIFPYSPQFEAVTYQNGRARVRFARAEGGLTTLDQTAPDWFQVSGADQQFRWAETRIDGDVVEVWHPEVPTPTAVRFAWDGGAIPNLAGALSRLPALPFRTDNWAKPAAAAVQHMTVTRLSPALSGDGLSAALASLPPLSLVEGGRTQATLRVAVQSNSLALHVEVRDALIASEQSSWAKAHLQLYLFKKGVRAITFPVKGPGPIPTVGVYDGKEKQGEVSLPSSRVDLLKPFGYTITALIPFSALALPDDSPDFSFEVSVCMTPRADLIRNNRRFMQTTQPWGSGNGFCKAEIR